MRFHPNAALDSHSIIEKLYPTVFYPTALASIANAANMNRLQFVCGILASALILPFCRIYLSRWRHRIESKRRGCGPLPEAAGQGALGVFGIYKILKALYHQTNSESFVQWTDSMGNQIHTCRHNIMGDDLFLTRDPENLKAICVTQVDDYDFSDRRMKILEPLIGTGVLNNSGEAWKHSRALLRPQFARELLSDLEMEERHLNDVWPLIDKGLADNGWTGVTDLQNIFFDMTMGISIDFLLGHKTNVHPGQVANRKGSDTKALLMREHYAAASVWTYIKFLFGKTHWMVPSWSLRYRSGKIREFFRPFIRAALDRLDEEVDASLTSDGRFVFLDELVKSTRDPVKLENEIVGTLAAARGTTAAFLTWTIYFLARNPQIYDKLRAAVVSQFGLTPNKITLKGLETCGYLSWVTRESLRLATVTPTISRSSLVDTTLPRGGGKDGTEPVFVPKGTEIQIALFLMHRRADIWGPDAEEFKPERWEGRPFGLEYSPFSTGRRRCMGREFHSRRFSLVESADIGNVEQFALAEAHYVLVRFLQRYDGIVSMEQVGPIRYNMTIITRNGKGCKVKLHRAEG